MVICMGRPVQGAGALAVGLPGAFVDGFADGFAEDMGFYHGGPPNGPVLG